uniref:Uncharacterized protein n=1 Tax=Oryza meridionalis TaxID=40149 RepID=A0A0E0F6C3_9ORYZ
MDETVATEGRSGMQQAPSIMAMASSGTWEVEMEKMINDIGPRYVETKRRREGRHSIYRVPEYIKDMTNRNAYRPQLVSLGPFHHGDPALLPMESHKRRAVAHLVKRSMKPLRLFIMAVEEIWRLGTSFVELMLTDGCFLLEMGMLFQQGGRVQQDYGPDDPVFSEHGYLYLMRQIFSDVHDGEINNWVRTFLCSSITHIAPVNGHLGLHPLDVLQKSTCAARRIGQGLKTLPIMTCATELHEAGIHFQLSDAKGFAGGVNFQGGVLSIPQVFLFDDAECVFLILMAFERLHPGAGNEVTAFIIFMDNLIDTAQDVALLRSKGIIQSGFGSDEAVANLINNILTKGAVMNINSSLRDVIREVNAHCRKPWNKWRASLIHTYFSNPWVFMSLVAAIILLVATLMRTIYTIMPFYKNISSPEPQPHM